jgi:hypothetical protein
VDVCQSSNDVLNLSDDAIIIIYEGCHVDDKLLRSLTGCVEKQANAAN